jgi:hypothetical protein
MPIMAWRDELVALLERAGLELAGEPCVEDVVPPPVAWRHVIRREARPTVEVALAASDADGEVRAAACRSVWPHLDAAARAALLADPHDHVRHAAAHPHLPVGLLTQSLRRSDTAEDADEGRTAAPVTA